MKKQYSTVLLALIGIFALNTGARAQNESKVVAKVPYEFVAGGKTFSAGTYTVSRVSTGTQRVLQIRNNETLQNSALLLPISSADAVDRVELRFQRVADTYYLSQVSTPAGVYTLSTRKAMTNVAKMKRHDTMSSAGTL